MIVIEIADNANCLPTERVFHELTPPQPVTRVRYERRFGQPQWCVVTGWTSRGTPCPAVLQKVDDSGEGVAFLVHGGDAGLRLQPAQHPSPWRIDDPRQWGEPLLILPAAEDVITEPAHG